jgi:hypothetical protein
MKSLGMGKRKSLGLLFVLTLCLLAFTACIEVPVGDTQIDPQSVELGNAKNVEVELHIGVGHLRLAGGAKKLLEGEFVYNVARWKPELKYEVFGENGKLTVRQPESHGAPTGGRTKNEWNLNLNEKVPLNLQVELGVGKSELELGSLNLKQLDIHTGVGECTLDLSGDWKQDLRADIDGGIGQVTLRLPAQVGVQAEVDKGIGGIHARDFKKEGNSYRNEAYGKSKVTLYLRIKAGIGEVRLELI